ncbi:methyltransferase, FxLD system [Actinoplanes sp. NPDC049596]|uniref:methyltransferase, FxLD system n=1 Tax=unclassified Actinoplanes TaxID=2626549 RepID=UPI003417FA55
MREREALADHLVCRGRITTPGVEAAFRRVPRHLFAPEGTSLADAYADDVVITRRGPDGKATSSISAPWLQAHMLEAAGLRPGARVLEIGSGGYNAALLAETVGPTGEVTSIDIDPVVVACARSALDRAGYGRVRVAQADAEYGWAAGAPYDAIVVTAEAGDIPPAWTEQLRPGGVLVAPLRIRANVRCLTLRAHGDHLVASAAVQCGFVPMQGDGRNTARRLPVRGQDVVLILDDPIEVDPGALAAALTMGRIELWSPVTVATSFESLHLWLASQPGPYGALAVDRERTAGLLDPQDRFVCPTLLTEDSFAYLTMRKADAGRWQLGAHGFGPAAAELTARMINLIAAWGREDPHITVHRSGDELPETPGRRLVVPRRHRLIAVTW